MSTHYLKRVSGACEDRVSLPRLWNDTRLGIHLDPSAIGTAIDENGVVRKKIII